MKTVQDVINVVCGLTEDQKQILKDTIKYGFWGDSDYEFLDECHNVVTDGMHGYCTNDAKMGGHFSGRALSNLFRGIYRVMCSEESRYKLGYVLSHCHDWWGDGSGDMLFIRNEWVPAFEQWANE